LFGVLAEATAALDADERRQFDNMRDRRSRLERKGR